MSQHQKGGEGRGETYLGRGVTTRLVGLYGRDVATRGAGSSLEWVSRRRKGGERRGHLLGRGAGGDHACGGFGWAWRGNAGMSSLGWERPWGSRLVCRASMRWWGCGGASVGA